MNKIWEDYAKAQQSKGAGSVMSTKRIDEEWLEKWDFANFSCNDCGHKWEVGDVITNIRTDEGETWGSKDVCESCLNNY